jgi:MFS family permease
LLKAPKFWHLFILLALLCGIGLMTINNIGNNARALWHHWDDTAGKEFLQKRQLMHVSILSVCSFLGRLSSGIGSDALIHRGWSRYWTLVASAALFAAAQTAALTISNPNSLFWLSILTGLAYGALFGVYPALVTDSFGPSGLGINWGAMTMAPVLSGQFFNLMYGRIFDSHSQFEGDGKGGGERVCPDGRQCYAGAYVFTLVASLLGVGWCFWCMREERRGKMRDLRGHGHGREGEGRHVA